MRRRALLGAAALAGCSAPLPPESFADTDPGFAPDRWFEGRTRSFGVMEARDGAPIGRFVVDGEGARAADGTLALTQTVTSEGEAPFVRRWRLRMLPDGRTIATGPAIVGEGSGTVRGRYWHLTYTEVLPPGGWLRTVRFEHWMQLSADGLALVNRFTVRKLGVVVARATEVFSRAQP